MSTKRSAKVEKELQRQVEEIQQHSEAKEFRDTFDFATAKTASNTAVVSVRLNDFEVEEINAKAKASGMPTSAILRSWILQGLKTEQEDSLFSNIAELELSVERLKRRLLTEHVPTVSQASSPKRVKRKPEESES